MMSPMPSKVKIAVPILVSKLVLQIIQNLVLIENLQQGPVSRIEIYNICNSLGADGVEVIVVEIP